MRICIDFDGVLHKRPDGPSSDAFVPRGGAIPGALEFVKRLYKQGHIVVILTARAGNQQGHTGVETWLIEQGFPPLEVTCLKPVCDLLIDDNAYRFTGSYDQLNLIFDLVDPYAGLDQLKNANGNT